MAGGGTVLKQATALARGDQSKLSVDLQGLIGSFKHQQKRKNSRAVQARAKAIVRRAVSEGIELPDVSGSSRRPAKRAATRNSAGD